MRKTENERLPGLEVQVPGPKSAAQDDYYVKFASYYVKICFNCQYVIFSSLLTFPVRSRVVAFIRCCTSCVGNNGFRLRRQRGCRHVAGLREKTLIPSFATVVTPKSCNWQVCRRCATSGMTDFLLLAILWIMSIIVVQSQPGRHQREGPVFVSGHRSGNYPFSF